MKMEDSNQRRK